MDLLKIQSPKQKGYIKTGYEILLNVIFNNTIMKSWFCTQWHYSLNRLWQINQFGYIIAHSSKQDKN